MSAIDFLPTQLPICVGVHHGYREIMSHDLVRQKEVTDVDELLDTLRRLAADAAQVDFGRSPRVLFRGHRDANWKLISLFHRQLERPTRKPYRDLYSSLARTASVPARWSSPSEWTQDHREVWEREARKLMRRTVSQFMAHALAARQLTGVAAVEASKALNVSGIEKATIDPDTEPTIYGLAQHHGLPSPWLDWTSDFHVALWFIVDDFMRENRKRQRNNKPPLDEHAIAEVWGMPRVLFEKGRPRLQLTIDQAYPTAQSGFFIYDHSFGSNFVTENVSLSVDERLIREGALSHSRPEVLRPFRVQFKCALIPKLRYELRGMGHTTATLKPSLDNIAKFVRDPGMA